MIRIFSKNVRERRASGNIMNLELAKIIIELRVFS